MRSTVYVRVFLFTDSEKNGDLEEEEGRLMEEVLGAADGVQVLLLCSHGGGLQRLCVALQRI